jgi:hypothetical protein
VFGSLVPKVTKISLTSSSQVDPNTPKISQSIKNDVEEKKA